MALTNARICHTPMVKTIEVIVGTLTSGTNVLLNAVSPARSIRFSILRTRSIFRPVLLRSYNSTHKFPSLTLTYILHSQVAEKLASRPSYASRLVAGVIPHVHFLQSYENFEHKDYDTMDGMKHKRQPKEETKATKRQQNRFGTHTG